MRPSDDRERIAAIGVSLALVIVALSWSLSHHGATLTSPQFVTAYVTTLTLCSLFTAILLIWRARLIGDASSVRIAAAFVYSAPLVFAYALTFPGVIPALVSEREASGWVWFGWRIGWAIALIWYAQARPRRHGGFRRNLVAALLVSAGVAALALSGKLPDWYVPESGAHLPPNLIAYWIMIAVTAAALGGVLRMKPMTTLNAWLIVPLVANITVAVLGLADRARFGGSSDASRLLAVVTSAIVVWALVSEFARVLSAHDRLEELYAREHRIAQTLQGAFVPPFLPNVRGLKFQTVYRPALRENELGGDWYDAFVLRDGRIALCIGDVAGHGIDAAIAMVRLRETLRAVTGFDDTDPGAILRLANRAFMDTLPDTIATAAFAIYDPPTRRLVHACAGHPPPALVKNGLTTFLNGSAGLPLGVRLDSTFASTSLVLEAGDMIVFYTDGLIEVDRDVVAGERRFADTLARYANDVERVVSETLGGEQHDDVALLALSLLDARAPAAWHFESDDAGSATDARFAFVSYLQRRNLDPDLVATAELVFGELVANVVRHAPGPIEIDLAWGDDTPVLAVRDRGPHFDVGSLALPEDDFAESGRGLFIITNAASPPVVTARPGGGNEVAVALATSATVSAG